MTGDGKEKDGDLNQCGEAIYSLFENGKSPLSWQFIRWKLWRKWPEFVGQTVAEGSEPVGYQHGTLIIWAKSASWMQNLVFLKRDIIQSINQKLKMNYVADVRFTLDRKYVPQDFGADQVRTSIQKIEKK